MVAVREKAHKPPRAFLPWLGADVLLRTFNCITMAYINRQGRGEVWRFLPGLENRDANLVSEGGLMSSEWRLHPSVIEQNWTWFGRPGGGAVCHLLQLSLSALVLPDTAG